MEDKVAPSTIYIGPSYHHNHEKEENEREEGEKHHSSKPYVDYIQEGEEHFVNIDLLNRCKTIYDTSTIGNLIEPHYFEKFLKALLGLWLME
jgi:hypothetical protein